LGWETFKFAKNKRDKTMSCSRRTPLRDGVSVAKHL
jgi:hypothetical protein